jgi:two-component system sensor histidine kinase BaeS
MLLPAATPGPRNGGPATLTRPIVVDGEEVGTVVIRFPAGSELSAPEAAALDALERIVLIGSVVAVLLAVLVATLVARRLTRPIRRMTTAASAIERGDLDARVGGSGPAELGDLANAFDRMAGALAREAELRRGLVADVAHELRTPVTILQGNLEEMVDGSLPATPIRLGSLHDEVLRLGRIVQDLETLAAAEAAGLELHRRTVDLAEVAGDAASLLEPWFSAAEVRLRPALSSVTVDGDPTRLNQIVTNLLTNALKFTPGGGAVEMVVRGDDGEAVLEVADTGPGIPSDELSHIFERFWRGSTARTTGGSGIGLSVVSELVHAHAGTVEATNAQGAGARFTVRIPAR